MSRRKKEPYIALLAGWRLKSGVVRSLGFIRPAPSEADARLLRRPVSAPCTRPSRNQTVHTNSSSDKKDCDPGLVLSSFVLKPIARVDPLRGTAFSRVGCADAVAEVSCSSFAYKNPRRLFLKHSFEQLNWARVPSGKCLFSWTKFKRLSEPSGL